MHDLVIRGGTLVDGTGSKPFQADVAIDGGLITAVGKIDAAGREEIDATGKIVTPGFVDVHTHYDGQAIWAEEMSPSSSHGVTTAVMGNCGVGFAPCRQEDHDMLINVMEGVEDIPGVVMAEGLPWNWETFPEYLTALEKRQRTIDVATHVPHGAVRAYVMGERGIQHDETTPDDLFEMCNIVREALKAGAIKAIWKVAGKYEVVAVMEVGSGDDLDAIVHSLPIWKLGYAHIVPEVNWIPLRSYENWSKQLATLKQG